MKNTKTIFKFFSLFEYEEEQAFLEKQHKEGWKAAGFKLPGFYKFEKCEPETMSYRIDFTDERKCDNSDYRQMFADNGWEYLWSVNGFSIFRKPVNENTPESGKEIFSDNESKLRMLQKIQIRRLLPLVTIFLCAVVPNFVKGIHGDFGMGITDIIFTSLFGLMFVLYTYIILKSLNKINSLKKKLQ